MTRLSQNAVWIPWTVGVSRWLSHLKQQALQPCPIPIPVRTDSRRRERGEFIRGESWSSNSQERC